MRLMNTAGQIGRFTFDEQYKMIAGLLTWGPEVDVGEWQAIRGDIPQAKTIEIEDVSLEFDLPPSIEELQNMVHPNLPWAEEHFEERVSGIPFNPPPSHVRWPFAQAGNSAHISDKKFSHTYPERMWPKFADIEEGYVDSQIPHHGIRYPYGDLEDVVQLLKRSPHTRQAYLPIWFPEDTGAVENQRVPCTLGYHLLLRDGKLKIVYYIRSCDFFRHFNDDVYMAGRLCQWMATQIGATPGRLVMHISSMHIFAPERGRVAAINGSKVPIHTTGS